MIETIKQPETQSYCITFLPVVSGVIDPVGAEQIFLKLAEEKFEELKSFFEMINKDNPKVKILIEKFEISKKNS